MQGAPALASTVQVKGPDEEKIKQILARTGYTLDVTTGMYPYIAGVKAYPFLSKFIFFM